MSSRITSSNKASSSKNPNNKKNAYDYAGKKTERKPSKPSLAQSSHHKGTRRAPFVDRKREFRKVLDLIQKSQRFDLPAGVEVTDIHADLAKVHIPYNSEDERAYLWRGAVIDYIRMVVVKWGVRTNILRVADDTQLEEVESIKPKEGNTFYFSAVFDGAVVSVFKYKGHVYFSTGRSLGVVSSSHPGAINIAENFQLIAPQGMLGEMFAEEVHTNIYYYDYILLVKGTLDVTKADVAVPSLIFTNRSRLSSDVSGSARAFTPVSDLVLTETDIYPTKPGFYSTNARLPMPVAQKYMSGAVTGAPEAVLAVERDAKTDKIVKMTRIQPDAVHARHLVRGDVQSVAVRLSQIIGDYEYDATTGDLIPFNAKAPIIRIPQEVSGGMLAALRVALYSALPEMRREDIDSAYSTIASLTDRLSHFFTIKKNPHHPALHYWEEAQGKTAEERAKIVMRMDQETLFHSLRWYKLV